MARKENKWLWDELQQARNKICYQRPSRLKQERINKVERTRDEALAEAQFLYQALVDERVRTMTERDLVQRIRAEETQEAMFLKDKLKVAKRTIEGLKDEADRHGQEVQMLQSKLSMSKAQLSQADTRLWRVKRMDYETKFNECQALAVQILPSVKVRLLQIPILAISYALAILQTSQGHGRGG